MSEIHVNMKQLYKWKVYSDNVIAYDQIIQSKGKFFTDRPEIYTRWLDEYGIFYTLKGAEKEIRKANPAPRKRAGAEADYLAFAVSVKKNPAMRATKTATVNVYEMYGTRGEYAADILYRGKLLKQFAGMDLASIFRQVEIWCTNQGYAIKLNDETRQRNPAPRKRAISRPSQVTKKAPTKRLVARRKVAAKKPVKGYFPNPLQEKMSVNKGKANFPYLVQRKNTENWNTSAAFKTKSEAFIFARELAQKYPRLPVRVMHYTGGPM